MFWPESLEPAEDEGLRWLFPLFRIEEYGFLRESEVNAGLLDFGERRDGPFQFAFECAGIIDVFSKFGNAQIGLGRIVRTRCGPLLGKPAEAISRRNSATRAEGARTDVPSSEMRYWVPVSFIFATMEAASSGESEV